MRLGTRKAIDRAYTGVALLAVGVAALSLLALLVPIIVGGLRAYVFQATVEHRAAQLGEFDVGAPDAVASERVAAAAARAPVYEAMAAFEAELADMNFMQRRNYATEYEEFQRLLANLLGPPPGADPHPVARENYGQTRWDRALVAQHELLYIEEWNYAHAGQMGTKSYRPRVELFADTALAPAFEHLQDDLDAMLRPRLTFYWRFLTQTSRDAHFFGGIWPEVLGTLYLTIGAILFAVPMGLISAIYLVEYAKDNWAIRALRSCVSTLAGVPSIVFGLFGLAFFIHGGLEVSESRSVLAGSLTLALLILPVVIRASEEAIRAVPRTYKEAALSLGAGKWRTVLTVILPAALPGVLTGVVISMGRAAGETAPIIFTAAVSSGGALMLHESLAQGTPALPWSVYTLCTEHEAVDEIRHVQYGMVLTLVALVLLLAGSAIVMRARISKKLTG